MPTTSRGGKRKVFIWKLLSINQTQQISSRIPGEIFRKFHGKFSQNEYTQLTAVLWIASLNSGRVGYHQNAKAVAAEALKKWNGGRSSRGRSLERGLTPLLWGSGVLPLGKF